MKLKTIIYLTLVRDAVLFLGVVGLALWKAIELFCAFWSRVLVMFVIVCSAKATAATILDASVIVLCPLSDGATGVGSGTIIDARDGCSLILTAGHVVRGAISNQVSIQFRDGVVACGTIREATQEPDLALVSVPTMARFIARLAESKPQRGEPTHLVGQLRVKQAAIDSVDKYRLPANFTIIGDSQSGDSGGGVFNANGELLGVLWGGSGNEGFATYNTEVRRLLSSRGVADKTCRWQRDQCGNWVKVCDRPPAQQQPTSVPQLAPPQQQPPQVADWKEPFAAQQAEVKKLQADVAALQQQASNCKPCECGDCCEKLRAEFSGKLETVSAMQVAVNNDIQQLQAAPPPTPNYDTIAAEVAKRLTHSATIKLLDGSSKTQTKPLAEPLEFIQHAKGLK